MDLQNLHKSFTVAPCRKRINSRWRQRKHTCLPDCRARVCAGSHIVDVRTHPHLKVLDQVMSTRSTVVEASLTPCWVATNGRRIVCEDALACVAVETLRVDALAAACASFLP